MITYIQLSKKNHLLLETLEEIADGEILEFDEKDVKNVVKTYNKKIKPKSLRIDDRIVEELFPESGSKDSKPERAQIVDKFKEYYSQFLADKNYPVKDIVMAIVAILWDEYSELSEELEIQVIPIQLYTKFLESMKEYLEILEKIDPKVMDDWDRVKDYSSLKQSVGKYE